MFISKKNKYKTEYVFHGKNINYLSKRVDEISQYPMNALNHLTKYYNTELRPFRGMLSF